MILVPLIPILFPIPVVLISILINSDSKFSQICGSNSDPVASDSDCDSGATQKFWFYQWLSMIPILNPVLSKFHDSKSDSSEFDFNSNSNSRVPYNVF